MEYDLDALSDRQFERLSQTLFHKYVGPSVSIFGDGPDGGREATWRGPVSSLSQGGTWDGYGVLQAKKCEHPSQKPIDNEKWFIKAAKAELEEWARADSKRSEKPDYIVFSTNVRISPSPGAGIDRVYEALNEHIGQLQLPIKGLKIWHYDEIQIMIHRDNGIYASFAAWITPGDVIARIVGDQTTSMDRLSEALRSHAAKSLLDDHYLNLTQAGNVADKPISIADVFIDLPIDGSVWSRRVKFDKTLGPVSMRISETLMHRANVHHKDATGPQDSVGKQVRSVVIGGPGQGKSTLTQFLAQVYRTEFIRDSPSARPHEVRSILQSLDARLSYLGIARPSARRWPIRVVLTELADSLQRGDCDSLVGFIALAVSRRADTPVDVDMMRNWLRTFPWILFIDGLDEVPASSNRNSVLGAIRDFEIEVATAEADVCVIATTRPQGYGDEFSSDIYRHYTLAPLPESIAMEYAKELVAVRAGRETESARLTLARLQRATQDETTSRLFSSPLQVTILTVLIERVGQVPRDRWRLFSDYYRVIYQREQEKGGEISDLLREFETDIHFIHREVGYLLQERSAIAGETSSFLTKAEFEECIRARLMNQGHDKTDVERLASDFRRLVIERLVFLAVVQSEHIGFELRSIQEFMAGESITNKPEETVLPEIKSLASQAHWRNAILFAFGRIFAEKDHLKAEAVQLLEQLNWELEHAGVRMIGSHIALDILLDGSCHSQPRYARPLAERACSLLDGTLLVREKDFSKLKDGHVGIIIRGKALNSSPTHLTHQLNRILVLSSLSRQGDREASEGLKALLGHSDISVLTAAATCARLRMDVCLAHALDPFMNEEVLGGMLEYTPSGLGEVMPDSLPEGSPSWLQAVHSLHPSTSDLEMTFPLIGNSHILAGANRINDQANSWKDLSAYCKEPLRDSVIGSISAFVDSPSALTLSAVLNAAAPGMNGHLLQCAPWPIAACFSSAANRGAATGDPEAGREWLRTLSVLAQEGRLGSLVDWEKAESRLEGGIRFEELMGGQPSTYSDKFGGWSLPLDVNQEAQIFPPLGLQFYVSYSTTDESLIDLLSVCNFLLNRLLEFDQSDAQLSSQELALFLAVAISGSASHADGQLASTSVFLENKQFIELAEKLSGLVLSGRIRQAYDSTHIGWANLLEYAPTEGLEVLAAVGSIRNLVFLFSVPLNDSWYDSVGLTGRTATSRCSVLRVLAHLDVRGFLRCATTASGKCSCSDLPADVHSRFTAFKRLVIAATGVIESGDLDSDILSVCDAGPQSHAGSKVPSDSVNADLLARVVEAKGEEGIALAVRCAAVLAPVAPLRAFAFAQLAGK